MANGPITLAQAEELVDAAFSRGLELECTPLTVVVLDPGGHVVVLKRQDRSGILRPQIALGKAWGALGMRLPSRSIGGLVEERPNFMVGLAAAAEGRIIPVPGGVLIRAGEEVVGAVGISGDTSDRDEDCAVAGIRTVGFDPDTDSSVPH